MYLIRGYSPKYVKNTYTSIEKKPTIQLKNGKKKMGRRSRQTFFQRRHTDSQQVHEKICNITNHQANENQNTEISLYLLEWLLSKKTRNNTCWQRCGEKGTSMYYYWWECKLVQPLWKTVCRFLKKKKKQKQNKKKTTQNYHMKQQSHF